MAEPFVGEIRTVGFTFAPPGWLACNGQIVNISEYDVLFALIGTTYGGDGINTFGLPDLRGRSPLHVGSYQGQSYLLGSQDGAETVTLTPDQMPSHVHPIGASSAAGATAGPAGQTFATSSIGQYETSGAQASGALLAVNAGGQAHANLMPYLTLNYIIATVGYYPSQT